MTAGASEHAARTDHARSLPLSSDIATMSISTSLRASARSAYRDLLRASSFTFQGDAYVQNGVYSTPTVANPSSHEPWSAAFRSKMRAEVIPGAGVTEPAAFEEKVKFAREIADVLRKNVVQARRVEKSEDDRWRAFFTCS